MTTKEELIPYVLQEVEGLRKYATKEQKAKLDLNELNPKWDSECIYGLMTGSCKSLEAAELAAKCGLFISFGRVQTSNTTLKDTLSSLIEEPKVSRSSFNSTFSPMEVYISIRPIDARNILRYIKGSIDELILVGE